MHKVGKVLNRGTHLAKQGGFRLETLLRLADTKAKNKKTSLLNYIVQVSENTAPELHDVDTKFPFALEGTRRLIRADFCKSSCVDEK